MIIEKTISEDKKVSQLSKKYSLQFLPEKLLKISELKNITFNSEKIKTSYIIDIVHNLLLKYYFRKENSFNLSSIILKERYGYLYNYYINYLKQENILHLKKNHLKGSNARIYSLNEDIFFASYANLPITDYTAYPPKISLEQYPFQQGELAMKIMVDILNRMNCNQDGNIDPVEQKVITTLISH